MEFDMHTYQMLTHRPLGDFDKILGKQFLN